MPQAMRSITFAALALARAAGAQTVSYGRDIAPLLAMNCHLCHGANPESAAGGLSTRTWADLKKGGNLGPVIVPGNPSQSALLQYIDGSRGERHRMPLGGQPLSRHQIGMIERWIRESASDDGGATNTYRLELPAVAFAMDKRVRVFCRLPVDGYLEVELSDQRGRVLYLDGGAVKTMRDVASLASAGQWVSWTLRRAPDWPSSVRVRLTISHAVEDPQGATLAAADNPNGVSPLLPEGEGRVRVISVSSGNVVFEGQIQSPGGILDPRRWTGGLQAGWYTVQFHGEAVRGDIATLVRVTPSAQ